MLSLTEFLLARIAEDEAAAREVPEHYAPFEREWEWCPRARSAPLGDLEWDRGAPCECHVATWQPSARLLAECEAKRRIVARAQRASEAFDRSINPTTSGVAMTMDLVLADLALTYADHEDYDESWRP